MSIEESQVRLHGVWSSPYVYRVIWALKIKGVKYQYIEEDLSNKSPALLEYNPVHKKVPMLVNGGKPVAESAVILQYIEEMWPDDQNPLLPIDPYERAMARFWIDFGQQTGLTFFAFFLSTEEERDERAKKVRETLTVIQDQALGNKRFFGGDSIGLVDLSFGWLAGPWYESSQELVGMQLLNPNNLPKLHRWTIDFKQQPVIKENLPDSKAILAHSERIRKKFISSEKIRKLFA